MKKQLIPLIILIIMTPLILWLLPYLNKPQIGGPFTLQSKGKSWSLEDAKGKLAILYFGYMRCPDICPTTLHKIKTTLNNLGTEKSQQIQTVFISVDHKSDKPELVHEYANNIHPSFIGVTGNKKEVDTVVNLYKSNYFFQKLEGSTFSYSVVHSNRLYLINRYGNYITSFVPETAKDLEAIINEHL
ncbi:MAG: SCO family protein [Bdellovibrionaceae bacterium]|jgi:protein SCO1|nr:SCO family protein [Pseudobdellovibrionaceae bacterium]